MSGVGVCVFFAVMQVRGLGPRAGLGGPGYSVHEMRLYYMMGSLSGAFWLGLSDFAGYLRRQQF